MKKRLAIVIGAALLATIAYVQYGYGEVENLPTVYKSAVTTGDVEQVVKAVGTLQPLRFVHVGSQVSGTVKALYADFNSVVKAGDVLAEIDPSLLEVQVAVQQANIARQENDIASQKVQLANDETNLSRARVQFEKGLVSQQDLEKAVLQVKTRKAQITAFEKQKVQAEAQLNQAKLNVSYCTIRSPIDGVVVSRLVDVGQAVQASMNAPQFFTLATDLTTLRVQAGVDEADIGFVRPGMPVTFTVESYRGRTFTGHVEAVRLNAQISNSVVTYPVWITADNPDLVLRPSMTANLQIVIASAADATLVPAAALQFRPNAEMYGWLKLPAPAPGSLRPLRLSAPTTAAPEAQAPGATVHAREGAKIDDLFAATPKRLSPGQVWIYDENDPDPARRLRQVTVTTGVTDEKLAEVVSGELAPGAQVVTGILPPPVAERAGFGGLFQSNQRQFGGMQRMEAPPPPRLNQRNTGGGRAR